MQWFPKSPVSSCISQNVDDLTGVEISKQHPGLYPGWVNSTATYSPTRPAPGRLWLFPFKCPFIKAVHLRILRFWSQEKNLCLGKWTFVLQCPSTLGDCCEFQLVVWIKWIKNEDGSENPLGMCIPPNGTRVLPSYAGNTNSFFPCWRRCLDSA